MAALIDALDAYLREYYQGHFATEVGDDAMLIVAQTRSGVSKTVKASVVSSRTCSTPVLRLRSRACLARDYQTVAEALLANAAVNWGGFALDNTTEPPVLDILYSMPASNVDPREFATAIDRVATLAAEVASQTGDMDRF